MSRPRTSLIGSCFLPLVAFTILAGVYLAIQAVTVPDRAARLFGPGRSDLSNVLKYRLAFTLVWQAEDLTQPYDSNGSARPFQIDLGEPTQSLINRLYQEGFIANPAALRAYLQYTGLDASLQAGSYQLSPAMTAVEIALALQDATPEDVPVIILAGWRVEEIAAVLPNTGLQVSSKALLSATQAHPFTYGLDEAIPPHATLEGFLYPGSYEIPRKATAPEVIELLVAAFRQAITPELEQDFESQGMTLYESVTLASILQKEAVVEDEMPLIASVFYNRLAAGMTLSSDPTVQYALGYNEQQGDWWTNPLSLENLKFESLYNTYLYAGLPPGPICQPGLNALRAVASPAQSTYYYFRARCDGSGLHAFAETYAQHLNNACP